jgi:hypothetical protein
MAQPHDGTVVLYDSIPRAITMIFNAIKECVDITRDIRNTERIARCTTQIDNESSALFLLLDVVAYFDGSKHDTKQLTFLR